MATKYVQSSGGGILGTLGGLATLGGMLIPGAQWLTPLGAGMSAVNSLMNGGGAESQVDALAKLKEVMSSWENPASGNIAKVASKVANNTMNAVNAVKPITSDAELYSRGWGAW